MQVRVPKFRVRLIAIRSDRRDRSQKTAEKLASPRLQIYSMVHAVGLVGNIRMFRAYADRNAIVPEDKAIQLFKNFALCLCILALDVGCGKGTQPQKPHRFARTIF